MITTLVLILVLKEKGWPSTDGQKSIGNITSLNPCSEGERMALVKTVEVTDTVES